MHVCVCSWIAFPHYSALVESSSNSNRAERRKTKEERREEKKEEYLRGRFRLFSYLCHMASHYRDM